MKELGTSSAREVTEVTNELSTRDSQTRHPLSHGKFTLALFLRNIFNPYQRRYPRTIKIGKSAALSTGGTKFPVNAVCNTKYNILTFVPLVLFQQFKFFINLYFLLVACCQFIPAIQTEDPLTYWGPLGFVLTITLIKEAIDDAVRLWRDNEINNEEYEILTPNGIGKIKSKDIKVGDLIVIHKDKRIPADVVLLRTTEKSGTCFVRTDQLDGEKDWKLRISIPPIQNLPDNGHILNLDCEIYAEKPQKDIHAFVGTYKILASTSSADGNGNSAEGSLSVENVLWANTVVASGTAIGLVIYTGYETRSVMNANLPETKVGLLDKEVNNLTKILFALVVLLSLVMVSLKRSEVRIEKNEMWTYVFEVLKEMLRFVLLFSYIIPISLRVNLDMAKISYSLLISRDKKIPKTIVRNSTIPEELGRISYLLSDKTGTLTNNIMKFKQIHLGCVFFNEKFEDITKHLNSAYSNTSSTADPISAKVKTTVEAISLCHNVTPIEENDEHVYQAASPDEIALVEWTEKVGIKLVSRDLTSMELELKNGNRKKFEILHLFPFTSETKRMGIIVRDDETKEVSFLIKGADTVMAPMVQCNDWLEEECSNMAREGLRTLVVARKILSPEQLADFETQFHAAKMSLIDRNEHIAAVLRRLETDLQLLCLTGVEDSLQDQVTTSLELLRNAGIKVWMLTGDKLETAICIAKSSGLFSKTDNIHVFGNVQNRRQARNELNRFKTLNDIALVMQGSSLDMCLRYFEKEVAALVCECSAVVCCRCSPEQKAQIVNLLKKYKKPARVAAIGDGGNDVSMIQAAHAGIGIDAREGKQASLAADFSITQFHHICRLFLVHGRFCYKRSCSLSQFVIHRGLILSSIQAIFSWMFFFVSFSFYPGVLLVGYATAYTMFPVFSLVLDRDITSAEALRYPKLYRVLTKGRSLSVKTFCIWLMISLYQGTVVMCGSYVGVYDNNFGDLLTVSFTALIFVELIMVALTIHKWHWAMYLAQALSVICFMVSVFCFPEYFDLKFITSANFILRTSLIILLACLPLYIIKVTRRALTSTSYNEI